ncbi:putative GEM-like protein 8 [Coffea arabica]|uniref:GEM-like protein 8 n=1 Tax=Coffea arabica TaxID=13443 RepID=A0A6P6V0T6_COFAR|nr:putative GEM-like protein 8 [Coffea arabica]
MKNAGTNQAKSLCRRGSLQLQLQSAILGKIMKNQLSSQVIQNSRCSAAYLLDKSRKRLLQNGHSDEYPKVEKGGVESLISRKYRFGIKRDNFAKGIREHVRLAPKLTETVKGKLSLGARILQLGGVEKVFKQLFSVTDSEKLSKASQCYLSTTSGPIAGLLFISTNKVAFCSERSIKILSPTGKQLRIYYKVSIPLRKIKRASASQNLEIPSQKYMEVVTQDNFEFWFMGFLNLRKTLKFLQQVIASQAQ